MMPRVVKAILVIMGLLMVLFLLGQETYEYDGREECDAEPRLGLVNQSEELECFKSGLRSSHRTVVFNAFNHASNHQSEVQEIALAIWRLERHKYPSFSWPILETDEIRLRVAELLLQIEKSGYRSDIDRTELLEFVREHLFAGRNYRLGYSYTLGQLGDESDVARLLDLARSNSSNAFEAAMVGLGASCFESALKGLDTLEKETRRKSRIEKIAETRARIIENRQTYYRCPNSAGPPPELNKSAGRAMTPEEMERTFADFPRTVEQFKADLAEANSVVLSRAFGGVMFFRTDDELPIILEAIWRGNREAYPSFSWEALAREEMRVKVAANLLFYEGLGCCAKGPVDGEELLEFVRGRLNSPDLGVVQSAAMALANHADPADVPLSKELALAPHYGRFEAGVMALSIMCSPAGLAAFAEVEELTHEPRRLAEIKLRRELRRRMADRTDPCKGR